MEILCALSFQSRYSAGAQTHGHVRRTELCIYPLHRTVLRPRVPSSQVEDTEMPTNIGGMQSIWQMSIQGDVLFTLWSQQIPLQDPQLIRRSLIGSQSPWSRTLVSGHRHLQFKSHGLVASQTLGLSESFWNCAHSQSQRLFLRQSEEHPYNPVNIAHSTRGRLIFVATHHVESIMFILEHGIPSIPRCQVTWKWKSLKKVGGCRIGPRAKNTQSS